MRALSRSGLFLPCWLIACSSTPLQTSGSELGGNKTYRLDSIAAPDGVLVVDAEDINDRGQVVGTAIGPAGSQDAYTWSAASGFSTLAPLPTADFMTGVAINESGVVAGHAQWQDGTSRPVIWTEPGFAQELGVSGTVSDINDRGHVVGSTSSLEGIGTAYLWDASGGARLLGTLGGSTSMAWGVNASDDVVGTSETADGLFHAFLWSRGTLTDLGALDGSYSDGYAISDAGEVTGTYQGPTDEIRVFRWTRSEGMVDVGPTYDGATDGATSLSTAINSVGQIVGGVQPPGLEIRAAVRQPRTGAWQELPNDGPFESFALGVNNRGVIVGRVATSVGLETPNRAAIWTPVGSVVGAGSP